MKILIRDAQIIGTALDTYTGPEQFIDAPEGFDQEQMDEYRVEDGRLISPPAPDPWQQARARLASIRYAHETGGIAIGGARIATDRQSQALITGAYTYSLLNPEALIDWKGADGAWTQIDAATIAGIARAVATHVQACFSNERALSELIDAAETVEDLASIDLESGWPS